MGLMGKKILGKKIGKKPIGKYVSRYIFSQKIIFLKRRTDVNFAFPVTNITESCPTHFGADC